MHWNPKEYGGLTHISFPPEQIWTPDIDLANTFVIKLHLTTLTNIKTGSLIYCSKTRYVYHVLHN